MNVRPCRVCDAGEIVKPERGPWPERCPACTKRRDAARKAAARAAKSSEPGARCPVSGWCSDCEKFHLAARKPYNIRRLPRRHEGLWRPDAIASREAIDSRPCECRECFELFLEFGLGERCLKCLSRFGRITSSGNSDHQEEPPQNVFELRPSVRDERAVAA